MNVTCHPTTLHGKINAIPSKSDVHRKLICAALSENSCVLQIQPPFCEDIEATIRCLTALGAQFSPESDGLHISPICAENKRRNVLLGCGESGSTFRFLLPVAAAVTDSADFTGSGRLPDRPISALTDAMAAHGVRFSSQKLPFSTSGILHGGRFEIAGNISSQFLSGLLMALPLCHEDSEIIVTTKLQSLSYVKMTLDTLKQFGIKIDVENDNCYHIKGNQKFHANSMISCDGDWSNGAFWLAANALGSTIQVSGLSDESIQGDKAISTILRDFQDAKSDLSVSMADIPDLLPILAVCASFRNGKTQFLNAERLRLKESDRLATIAEMIRNLGGKIEEGSDNLTVFGVGLEGGLVHANGDHRLAMAAAIAALKCKFPVEIIQADAVKKSYPAFFEDYSELGGICSGLDLR